MVNENLKFNKNGKYIVEFLIMPRFRRNHSGKRVAYEIFEKFRGDWEVQPIENIIEVESILIDKLDK